VKLFVEVVLILVVMILNFKSLYPNIDTKQKKFKKMGNFFIVARKKHPKTFLLQDKKDASQPPVLKRTFHD
jgi:hypothetical protein